MVNALAAFSWLRIERSGLRPSSILTQFTPSSDPVLRRYTLLSQWHFLALCTSK